MQARSSFQVSEKAGVLFKLGWIKISGSVLPIYGGILSLGVFIGSRFSQDISQNSIFGPNEEIRTPKYLRMKFRSTDSISTAFSRVCFFISSNQLSIEKGSQFCQLCKSLAW